MTNTKDALGNEIVIGNNYGFSKDSNGLTTIGIGKAEKITEKGYVTLRLYEYKSAIYNNEAKPAETRGTASVKPLKLFPINQ